MRQRLDRHIWQRLTWLTRSLWRTRLRGPGPSEDAVPELRHLSLCSNVHEWGDLFLVLSFVVHQLPSSLSDSLHELTETCDQMKRYLEQNLKAFGGKVQDRPDQLAARGFIWKICADMSTLNHWRNQTDWQVEASWGVLMSAPPSSSDEEKNLHILVY